MSFMLSDAAICEIEKKIGHTFKNKALLVQAFTRRSYQNEEAQKGKKTMQSNEVLEFLGDAILGAVVASTLLSRHGNTEKGYLATEMDEGAFSTVKSRMSDKSMLSGRMTEMGLHRYLRVSNGDREGGIIDEPSVKEDLFESIIGAVFLDTDRDFAATAAVVSEMLDIEEYLNKGSNTKNAKNLLQEYCQAKRLTFRYENLGVSGPEHAPTYEVALYIGDERYAVASGKNLKKAEMEAASGALMRLDGEKTVSSPREKNPRTFLKEWADKEKCRVEYTVEERENAPFTARFFAVCLVEGKTFGEGVGGSKKEAMTAAAKKAYERLTEKE